MIKLKVIIEMVGQITYYLGRSWRKIPIQSWLPDNDIVTDDYSAISAWCPDCKQKTMQVVRPGSYQCSNCG
jgi:hypothetical protein